MRCPFDQDGKPIPAPLIIKIEVWGIHRRLSRGEAERYHLKEARRLALVWREAGQYDFHMSQARLNRLWRLHESVGSPTSIRQATTPDAMATLRAAIEQGVADDRRFSRRMSWFSLASGCVALMATVAIVARTWGWL